MYDVFISYSFKDQDIADKVINGLANNSLSYWICTEQIRGGGKFYDEISDAITASKVLVFIQTKNSVDSKEIPDEIFQALDEGKQIITFLVEDSQLHGMMKLKLKSKQYVDARNGRLKSKINELANEIKHTLRQENDADSESTDKAVPEESNAEDDSAVDRQTEETVNDLKQNIKKHSKLTGWLHNCNLLGWVYNLLNVMSAYIILRVVAFPYMVTCFIRFAADTESGTANLIYRIFVRIFAYLSGAKNEGHGLWFINGEVANPEFGEQIDPAGFAFCVISVIVVAAITVSMLILLKKRPRQTIFTVLLFVVALVIAIIKNAIFGYAYILWFALFAVFVLLCVLEFIKNRKQR